MIWLADTDFQQQVDRLIKGETIEINIRHDISYETFRTFSEQSLWSLLYYSGYLTIRKSDVVEDAEMIEVDQGTYCISFQY